MQDNHLSPPCVSSRSPVSAHSAVSRRHSLEELAARIDWALPAFAALAAAIVRLPELTRSPLWFDELFSMGVASMPAGEALRRIIADHTNPPLFYLLLKGWMAMGGESDAWVRLLPCLLSVLAVGALVWLAREARAGAVAGALAIALFVASPLSVDLANEVRAYALLSLLATLSLAATLQEVRRPSRAALLQLTLINIALVHTHYFGWFTVGAEVAVGALVWRGESARRITRSAVYTAVAFLSWAAAVVVNAARETTPLRNVAWIGAPDLAAPLWLLRDFTGRSGYAAADLAWLAFVCCALALLARRAVQQRAATRSIDERAAPQAAEAGTLALLATAGLGVPLVLWVASLAGAHSIWVQRYLLGAAAPVALLVAIAIAALPPRRWRVAAIIGACWVAVALAELPKRPPTKFDWRRFTRRIDVAPGSPSNLYALEAFTAAPLQRYARPGMLVHLIGSLDQLPDGDAWLVYRPESFASRTPADALLARNYRVLTSLTAETAGQRIVAMRITRPTPSSAH